MKDHGTWSRYQHGGCRCSECRTAATKYQNDRRAIRAAKIQGDEDWHGTLTGYAGYGCRCTACLSARRTHMREYRLKRRANALAGGFGPEDPRHGTNYGYAVIGCRCDPCVAWKSMSGFQVKYKLDPARMAELIDSQDGKCGICQRVLESTKYHIDHAHSCCPGQETCGNCIRGVLCVRCNTALGAFGDTVEGVMRAVDYLKAHDLRNDSISK